MKMNSLKEFKAIADSGSWSETYADGGPDVFIRVELGSELVDLLDFRELAG